MSINELRNLNKDMSRRRHETKKKNELEHKKEYSEFCEKSVENKKELEEQITGPRRNGIQRYAKHVILYAVLAMIVFLDVKLAVNLFQDPKIQRKKPDKAVVPENPEDLKVFVEEIKNAYLKGGRSAIERYWAENLPPFLKKNGLRKMVSADFNGDLKFISVGKDPQYSSYAITCKDAALNTIIFKIFKTQQNQYALTAVY